jgi:glycerol-3-phosphate dehydrogenase
VYGGHIERFDDFLRDEIKQRPCELKDGSLRRLICNYGSAYREVLDYLDIAQLRAMAEDVAVLRAQVRHSVHNEMAQKLSDVIFRRTELGTAGNPGREVLEFSANVIATELGWSQSRVQEELREVICAFNLPAPSKPEPGTGPDTESRSLEQTDGTKLADKAVQ